MTTSIFPMESIRTTILTALGLLTLQGCASLGQSNYSCSGKPDGSFCMSMQDTYQVTDGDDYRAQVQARRTAGDDGDTNPRSLEANAAPAAPGSFGANAPRPYMPEMEGNTLPIRTPAQVMRIWVAPWENQEGDLMMTGLVYTEVHKRRWQVGLERPDIRDIIRPLGSVK
jgi:conjugal transfer pilus assembly protein TraV